LLNLPSLIDEDLKEICYKNVTIGEFIRNKWQKIPSLKALGYNQREELKNLA